MRRSVLCGLVCGLVIAAGGSAHAVLLRYAPVVGTTGEYAYHLTSRIQATTGAAAMLSEMDMKADATQRAVSRIRGGTRVDLTLRRTTVTTSAPGGGGKQATQKKPDATTEMVVTPRGRMRRALDRKTAAALAMEETLANLLSFCVFPEKNVKVGDTWTDRLENAADAKIRVVITRTSRLLEVGTYRGRPCAKIRTTFGGSIGGGATPGSGVDLQGASTQHYDYQHGLWVGVQSRATMTLRQARGSERTTGSTLPPATRVTTVTLTMLLKQ